MQRREVKRARQERALVFDRGGNNSTNIGVEGMPIIDKREEVAVFKGSTSGKSQENPHCHPKVG